MDFSEYTFDSTIVELVDNINLVSESVQSDFNATGFAMALGLCLALVAGAYECYMMMLGKQGLDVMKLLRIVGISICISLSGVIADMATAPGEFFEAGAKEVAQNYNQDVMTLEAQRANVQNLYYEALSGRLQEAQSALEASKTQQREELRDASETDGQMSSTPSQSVASIDDSDSSGWGIGATIKKWSKQCMLLIQQKITEFLNTLIRYVATLIFQVAFMALLLGQKIFICIMKIFGPIAFALSLAPPFRSAWSQWLSKVISLSLWGFLIYFIMCYILKIQEYFITSDIETYEALINTGATGFDDLFAQSLSSFGASLKIALGWLVGVVILASVPEVSSWLIPGGVSSGFSSIASSIGSMAGSAIGSTAGTVGGALIHAPGHLASAAGRHAGGESFGSIAASKIPVLKQYKKGKSGGNG